MFPLHATCMPDTENRSSLSINASQPRLRCRCATFLGNNGEIGGALRLSGIGLSPGRRAISNVDGLAGGGGPRPEGPPPKHFSSPRARGEGVRVQVRFVKQTVPRNSA